MAKTISHGWTTAEPDDPAKDVSARNLNDHQETYSGLTAGHVLRATGAAAADFGALQDGDIPASIARDSEVTAAIAALSTVYQPVGDYLTLLAPSTGVDDTTLIQAALTAARTAGGGVVKGLPGETYEITDTLIIGSGTTLDMTGCTVHCATSLAPMLQNYNHQGGGRDTDISLGGGTWSETGDPLVIGEFGDTHRIDLNQVDRVTVADLRVTSTSGKYAIALSDVTLFDVHGITVDVFSSAVQVTGPAAIGHIANVSGTTVDDMVAMGCSDYPAYDLSRGDITDVTIERIRIDNPSDGVGRGVVLFTTGDASYVPQALAMRRVTVRDIKGTIQNNGIVIDDITNALAAMSDITISDISLIVPAGYANVFLDSAVSLSGIHIENIHIPAGAATNTAAVWVSSNLDLLTVAGIRSGSTNRAVAVRTDDGITVGAITLADVAMILPTDLSYIVSVGDGTTISTLQLVDISVTGSAGGSIVVLAGTGAITRMNLVNITYDAGAGGIVYHQASTTPDVNFANVRMLAAGGVIFYILGTGGIVIRGSGATAPTYWVYRTSTQVVNCYSTDIHVDVDLLTPTAGAMAFNTNGGHACGVGPVVSEGTHWKGLYNGTAYP